MVTPKVATDDGHIDLVGLDVGNVEVEGGGTCDVKGGDP